MLKDIYLFTNGTIAAFNENGEQVAELQGKLTEDLQKRIEPLTASSTRITFARWKKGFFELTKEELMATEIDENGILILRFATDKDHPAWQEKKSEAGRSN